MGILEESITNKKTKVMEYKDYKRSLSRFGFSPNGRNREEWDFRLITRNNGVYEVCIYLDIFETPFEYRVDFSCGKTEDCDLTYGSFDDLLSAIRALKKANR